MSVELRYITGTRTVQIQGTEQHQQFFPFKQKTEAAPSVQKSNMMGSQAPVIPYVASIRSLKMTITSRQVSSHKHIV